MVGVHEVSVTGINGTLVPHQRHVGAVAQPAGTPPGGLSCRAYPVNPGAAGLRPGRGRDQCRSGRPCPRVSARPVYRMPVWHCLPPGQWRQRPGHVPGRNCAPAFHEASSRPRSNPQVNNLRAHFTRFAPGSWDGASPGAGEVITSSARSCRSAGTAGRTSTRAIVTCSTGKTSAASYSTSTSLRRIRRTRTTIFLNGRHPPVRRSRATPPGRAPPARGPGAHGSRGRR